MEKNKTECLKYVRNDKRWRDWDAAEAMMMISQSWKQTKWTKVILTQKFELKNPVDEKMKDLNCSVTIRENKSGI